jgi:hypothetical protein
MIINAAKIISKGINARITEPLYQKRKEKNEV